MMPSLAVALVAFVATWDAWRWYLGRVAAQPEEAAALLLTVVFFAVAGWMRRGEGRAAAGETADRDPPMLLVTGLLAAYAASFAVAPAIVRAAIAIATVLFCLHHAAFRRAPPAAFWGLVALTLPVLPSLQFVLGYPMRLVSAAITVGLLQLQGLSVTQQGTYLVWRGDMVQFDAPCSGVNMLWAGLLLALMGSVLLRFDVWRTVLVALLTCAVAIAFNALRAASLFYMEAKMVASVPAWWHEGVGVVAFVLAAAVIGGLLTRLQPGDVKA